MMVSIYAVYAWRVGGTKFVVKAFVGLTSAHAKRKEKGTLLSA